MDPTTIPLDADTAARLERLARQWNLTPAAALSRALTQAEQPPALPLFPFPATPEGADTASTSPVIYAAWSRD